MCIVEDPGADTQKILEALVTDEVLPVHADPGEESLVGSDDRTIRQGQKVAAGGAFVETPRQISISDPWSIFTLRRPFPEAGSLRNATHGSDRSPLAHSGSGSALWP